MIAVPNKEQIKYTSATIQESNVYNKLKLFFELRRDDESPFTVEEILNCYFVCRSGKSFAARPGDMIVVLSALPNAKKAQAMLRVRKGVGLYGLVSLVPGMALKGEELNEEFEREYYVINPKKDKKLLKHLALERIVATIVGTVIREGYFICRGDEEPEEITVSEQQENCARIPRTYSFTQGYLMGAKAAFEGKWEPCGDDVGMALGMFSAFFDIRCNGIFTYSGAQKGNGLFLFAISSRGRNPDRRGRLAYKRISKGMKKGTVTDCVIFNDGDISAAKCRLSGEEYPEQPERFLKEGTWYALIASGGPIRGGYYLGRL